MERWIDARNLLCRLNWPDDFYDGERCGKHRLVQNNVFRYWLLYRQITNNLSSLFFHPNQDFSHSVSTNLNQAGEGGLGQHFLL